MKLHHGTLLDRHPDGLMHVQTANGTIEAVKPEADDIERAGWLHGGALVTFAYRGGRAFYVPQERAQAEWWRQQQERDA